MTNLNVGAAVAIEYTGSDDTVKTVVGTVENVGSDRVLVKVDGQFDVLKKSHEKRQAFRTIIFSKILNVSAQ
jgi:hypothetical protein